MSDAGAIYCANHEAAEATNRLARLALDLARELTELLEGAPPDEGAPEDAKVAIYTTWVQLRRARAALEAIADPDW